MSVNTDVVKNILNNPDYCPVLLIGGYVIEFKKRYLKNIHKASTLDDVRELVYNYSGILDLEGNYMVLDGIGFLSDSGSNSLLKFIEESLFPVVCLSLYDRVLPTIASRMKFIYKSPLNPVRDLEFVGLRNAFDQMDSWEREDKKNLSYYERTKFFVENNPIGYYLEMMGNSRMDRKINRIISKIK